MQEMQEIWGQKKQKEFLDCDDYFNKNLCHSAYNKAKLFEADIVFLEYEALRDDDNKKQTKRIHLDSNILCNCTFSSKQMEKICSKLLLYVHGIKCLIENL